MIKKISYFLFFLYMLSSCVPHRKIVYFQGEPKENSQVRALNNKPYRLKVDDVLRIDIKASDKKLVDVFQNNSANQNINQLSESSSYFSGYSIDKQGFIEMPFLKKINVLGFTTDEVSDKITTKLAHFFKNVDDIYVAVKLAGVRYTIIGEVTSTGSKVLYKNNVNIIEAIANSGDIKLTGDKTNVELIRIGVDGIKKYHLDLTQLDVFESEVFYIEPNDIINVPALKQKTLGTGTTGAQTLTTVISVLSLLTTSYLLIKSL